MTKQPSMIAAAAMLATILTFGTAATGMAQTPTPAHDKMPKHQVGKAGMKDMHDMSGMMAGPHHVLAMAYRDNLVTFARALQGQVIRAKTVDLDMARPATAEMTRSFDQMKEHHVAQMKMMGEQKKPMPAMQQHEAQLASLDEHLTALRAEVNLGTPDPKKVSGHTTEILKHCARMSAMSGTAKPHAMK